MADKKRKAKPTTRTAITRYKTAAADAQRESQMLRGALDDVRRLIGQYFGGTVPETEREGYLGTAYRRADEALTMPIPINA